MAVDHNNPQSRNEEILIAAIDGKEYNKPPQSRIEELLLELKEVIEAGGGGGTTNYNLLSNRPTVNNILLEGNKTAEDLNLVLAEVGKGLSTNDYSNEEKAKVANLLTSIQSILDGTDIDSFGDVEIALLDKADISDLGTAAAKDSTNAVTSGSTDLVESGAVKDAIDAAVAAAYHHAGTKTVAQLTHDLLVAANEGNVYNITDSGTTTSDFIEGIGKTIDEGSNVGICKVGNVYMFDLLSGFVDTTNFVQKSQTAGLLKNDGTVNTTIEDDVDQLKSGLINLTDAVGWDNHYNQWDETWEVGTLHTSTGLPATNPNCIRTKGYISVSQNTTYYCCASGNTIFALFYDSANNVITGYSTGKSSYENASQIDDHVFTTPQNCAKIKFYVTGGSKYNNDISINYPSTITTYEPYHPVIGDALTDLDVALSVPDGSGKNLIPMTVKGIKAANTAGTWSNNTYTYRGISYTLQTNTNGKVVGILVNGTNTASAASEMTTPLCTIDSNYVLSGCPSGGSENTYSLAVWRNGTIIVYDTGNGAIVPAGEQQISVRVRPGVTVDNIAFYPMLRPATITDPTFAPYIPSVESRIEAVESGLINVLTDISANTHLNKDSNLDTLPLGWYGINTYEGSGTGTGIPSYNTVGILWHVKGASNSFMQFIFGYNYTACRIRSNTIDAWDAWKFGHNALPT